MLTSAGCSAAAAALGELVQDHGLLALEAMLNKATGYLLHRSMRSVC